MKAALVVVLIVAFVAFASAKVYFKEDFSQPGWESRWVVSKSKEAEGTLGKFVLTSGKWFNSESDKGLQTSEDARFYQISSKFPSSYKNADKPLVIQYTVKHEQKLDCGGAYIKLLPAGLDQSNFNGDSKYNVMFGPDVCGSTKKVHTILNYKGDNHLITKNVHPETDQLTHLYTLILNPDQTYEILVDGSSKQKGSVTEDWTILPPQKIKDPKFSKPTDWVDEARITDPSAVKPAGWDSVPKEITDPDATKPADWDNELDGEWESPSIPNPEYKGEWRAPQIDNPDYKGPWVHPEIDNPDYVDDKTITQYESSFLGIEIWQVKSGSIFGNFLVTDDVAEAQAFADGAFQTLKEGEKKSFDEQEAARKEKEDAERASTKSESEEKVPEDDDDDDDDEKKKDEL